MNWERLSGSHVVDLIRNWRDMWNSRIMPKLRSMELVAGPGIRLNKGPSGVVISAVPISSTRHGSSPVSPLWQVSVSDDGLLVVSGGWINRNGLEVIWYAGATISPQTGTLCICTEPIDKAGKWRDIQLKFITPNPCAYPIAKITCQGDEVTIEQYPVTVAMIFRSKRCPIAKM